MRVASQVAAGFILLAGIFWTGRESSHGLTAFWEHWWCPIPLALVLAGAAALIAVRRTRAS